MNRRGLNTVWELPEGTRYSETSAEEPARPQNLAHTVVSPYYFSHLQYPFQPLPMSLPPVFHVLPAQIDGATPMAANRPVPGTLQHALAMQATPNQFVPADPFYPTIPIQMPQPDVLFDPTTPPPLADVAALRAPRRYGVLKVTNVSFPLEAPS
jgi:hypothetical protein